MANLIIDIDRRFTVRGFEYPTVPPLYLTESIKLFSPMNGIVLKFGPILPFLGSRLCHTVQEEYKAKMFADWKISGDPQAIRETISYLKTQPVEMISIDPTMDVELMKFVKKELGETQIFATTVTTNYTEKRTEKVFGCSVREAILRFAGLASEAGIGVIVPCAEIGVVREKFKEISIIAAGIRPTWFPNAGSHRPDIVGTPADAIQKGANFIIVGEPIMSQENSQKQLEAAHEIIREIEAASLQLHSF